MTSPTPQITRLDVAMLAQVISGYEIPVAADIFTVAEDQDLKAFEAVSFDADGNVVSAEHGAGAGAVAVGITAFPIVTGPGENPTAQIVVAGVFDPNEIVFDASFDTHEKRAAAFRGASSPTNIILKARF